MADPQLMDWYDDITAKVEAYPHLIAALEQIRALQPLHPMEGVYGETEDMYTRGYADGQWDAGQIADAALAPLLEHSPMPGEGDRDADTKGDEAGGV